MWTFKSRRRTIAEPMAPPAPIVETTIQVIAPPKKPQRPRMTATERAKNKEMLHKRRTKKVNKRRCRTRKKRKKRKRGVKRRPLP